MKFKNFISAFFLAAAVVCLVACSDDEDEVINNNDEPEVVDPNQESGEDPDEPDEPDEPVTSALSAPTGITAYDWSGNWVAINWNSVDGAAAYKVRATDAAGTEVFSQIVSVNDCTIENLTPSTTYTAYVKALAEETEGSEFDSEEASHEITTTGDVPMIAPINAEIVMVTHGFAIIGWELTDEAITQQPSSSSQDDKYDFRLKDANGKVLRLLEDDNCFNFAKYPKHQFVWGGLEPSTTYSLELRRKPVSATGVVASDWVSASFTTEADPVPDKSGYLLFYDFENVPFGGSGPYEAYGTRITLADSNNYDDPNALDWIVTGDSNLNYVYTQTISDAAGFNQSFFDNYLPGVTPADFTNGLSSYIAVAPGHLKFGASSEKNWFSLPALNLTAATNVKLVVDAMVYIEPSSSGDMMSPSNAEITSGVDANHFYVDAGNATITSVDCEKEGYGNDEGATDHIAYIKMPTVAEMSVEGATSPYWTTYTIHISGLTGNDRIKIYTDPETYTSNQQRRMWMDNIKISVEN